MPRKTTPTPAPSRPSDASLLHSRILSSLKASARSTYFKMRELGLGPIESKIPRPDHRTDLPRKPATVARTYGTTRRRTQAEKIAADFAARSASCKKKAKECQEGIRNGSIVKKKRQ